MNNLLIINTGGTFNKRYNPLSGELEVDQEGSAVKTLLGKWLCDEIETVNIIGKDSLQMTSQDRFELLLSINQTDKEKIIIIHGTDTMHITAEYLAESELENKQIVLTGAMVPYSIDPVEATANFAAAMGFLANLSESGVYISMNGWVGHYRSLRKDTKAGRFIPKVVR
jgi:L-asparaginase